MTDVGRLAGETVREARLVRDPKTGGMWLEMEFVGDQVALRAAAECITLYGGGLPPLEPGGPRTWLPMAGRKPMVWDGPDHCPPEDHE